MRPAETLNAVHRGLPAAPAQLLTQAAVPQAITAAAAKKDAAKPAQPVVADIAVPLQRLAAETRIPGNWTLAENMCRSMRARGINGNEEILTRRKYLSKKDERDIRSKSKCNGRTKCVSGESCDEYPPASTEEGYQGLYGIDVFSQCIDEIQNTNGGRQLSSLYSRGSKALPSGTKFVVRVTNLDCNTIDPAEPKKRRSIPPQARNQRRSDEGTATTIYLPLDGDPSGYTLLAFGDLDPAEYTITLTSSAQIDSWQVYDRPALEIESGDVIAPNAVTTIQFSLDIRDFGVSLVAFTESEEIEIQWTLTSTPLPSSSSAIPTATPAA